MKLTFSITGNFVERCQSCVSTSKFILRFSNAKLTNAVIKSMILENLSSVKAQYKVTQIHSTKEWNGNLSGGCQKVLVLPKGYNYSVVFNAIGQQTYLVQNLVPCAKVSFTVSNGIVSVSIKDISTLLKSNTTYLKSMSCDIEKYPQIYLNQNYINTLSMIELSISLLLAGVKVGNLL